MTRTLTFASSVLALAVATGAMAQTTTTPPPRDMPAAPRAAAPLAPSAVQQPGQVDADKLIGRNIQNAQNETIGEVKSVMLGADGKVQAVIVGVGGFLGVGEREVALNWSDLQISQNGEKITVSMTKDQLKALPEYAYADRTHRGTVFTARDGTTRATRPDVAAPATQTDRRAMTQDQRAPAAGTAALAGAPVVSASKLVGLDIRNANDETIGEVKDVAIADDGKVAGVIVNVGGFLGIGDRNVAIDWSDLKVQRDKDNALRAQAAFTKEQLKAMPEYRLDKQTWLRK